ncbi:hypothetical protein EII17_05610 [Clostridiales bacterium COT073_COT-073]|nr:hypothetical protein EII17_05610 [Clostridiales bacterium COT073_COT-073]
MKRRLFTLIPYMVGLTIIFYMLPLLIRDTGSGMFILLLVIPVLTFICSITYGIKQGFDLLFSFAVAILFVPTILIYYNLSAWIYIIVYALISLAGNGIGKIFHKRKQR